MLADAMLRWDTHGLSAAWELYRQANTAATPGAHFITPFLFSRYRVDSTRAACKQVVGHTKAIGTQLEMYHVKYNDLPTLTQAGA